MQTAVPAGTAVFRGKWKRTDSRFAAFDGRGGASLPFLRTEMPLRDIPVFRMAYFTIKPYYGLTSKTLMLQVRSAHPPMPHRNVFSKHPGVPLGLFSDSAPTHLRCAGVPLGLFGKPKRSSSSRVRGLRWAGGASLPPAPPSPAPGMRGEDAVDKRGKSAAGRTAKKEECEGFPGIPPFVFGCQISRSNRFSRCAAVWRSRRAAASKGTSFSSKARVRFSAV